MAYAFSGQPDRYSTLRGQILDFIKPGSTIQSPEPGGSLPWLEIIDVLRRRCECNKGSEPQSRDMG